MHLHFQIRLYKIDVHAVGYVFSAGKTSDISKMICALV